MATFDHPPWLIYYDFNTFIFCIPVRFLSWIMHKTTLQWFLHWNLHFLLPNIVNVTSSSPGYKIGHCPLEVRTEQDFQPFLFSNYRYINQSHFLATTLRWWPSQLLFLPGFICKNVYCPLLINEVQCLFLKGAFVFSFWANSCLQGSEA